MTECSNNDNNLIDEYEYVHTIREGYREHYIINNDYGVFDSLNKLNDDLTQDKTIVHVLNCNYCSGLGDFIRGSITVAQLAKHFNIKFQLTLQHNPISNYIIHYENSPPVDKYIHRPELNFTWLYNIINDFMKTDDKIIYVQACSWYVSKYITPDIMDYMKTRFTFKDECHQAVLPHISQFKYYNVIQIRCMDKHFNKHYYDDNLIEKISELNLENNTIVMSSNYNLKKLISKMFGFYFIDKEPGHSDVTTKFWELDLTVTEFLILSKSSRIVCFSCYNHGSGFSEMPSVLNSIPYEVFRIPDPAPL